jgi:hypothetical protein
MLLGMEESEQGPGQDRNAAGATQAGPHPAPLPPHQRGRGLSSGSTLHSDRVYSQSDT